MPAIEERRIKLHTAPIFLHRALEFADRKVAIRVVEDVLEFIHQRAGRGATNV